MARALHPRWSVACLLTWMVFALMAPPAGAQTALSAVDEAVQGLENDPVYVDPEAERALSEREAERLREQIRRSAGVPMYVAVLPDSARDAAGGDPGGTLREVALGVGEPGVYAALIGDSFRAGATQGVLSTGEAGRLAADALDEHRDDGTFAVLRDFVRKVGSARRDESSGNEGGGGFPWGLVLLLGIPTLLLGFRARRKRREQAEQLEQVKDFARDDLVALGEDIRRLDLDIEMPGVDPAARQHYERALQCYDEANQRWSRARRAEDMEGVASLLEEGRYELVAASARLEGRPEPERRPPCFFDPRHGPSTTDVEWAPPGGAPRPVPVCAADATRIADGLEPHARQVPVGGGQMTPYWNAGPAYLPWAGGFFGGGLLPGLFIGSMLGGGFGMLGGAYAGDAMASDVDGGDFGGFGGGDFGGGDFGGGGDF